MQTELFDKSATAFAAQIDAQIAAGVYVRGRLFADSISRNVRPGGDVLDYGCGPGRITRIIASRGYSVMGIDPSAPMIECAQSQPLGELAVRFSVCDDGGASLPDHAFDGIVCSSVIEFVPNATALLEELRRVRRRLRDLSSNSWIGTLGLVAARPETL
jgi:2-polyprenyl-3-methyl-5-hydroxy-6-metoxy-1,4-benzoquinol methylase